MDKPIMNEHKYGWGKFRPKCLQVFNGPKSYLASLSLLCIMKTFTTGYLNQMIPTIEKRFQMTSKDLGIIAASQDIPGLIIIGFVSYFGEHGNKIKWLGYGGIITGIGSLLSVLPHLIVGEYNPTVSAASNLSSQPLDVCVPTNSTAGGGASCILQYDSQWFYLLVFIASQILIGVGSTALFSLGPAYLDENLHPKSVPVYIGFWYSTTWLGPGLGFILGGVISTIYVDITLPEGVHLTPFDAKWIGAWWLGFLAAGILNILVSIIMLGFPRELPGAAEVREKAMEAGYVAKRDENINGKLKEIVPATKLLLRNATYMFNTVALTINILYIQGSSAFIAKMIHLKFGVDYNTIGIILGSVFTPTGIAGILLGGVICRCFNLKKSCKMAALTVVVLHFFIFWGGFNWSIPGCNEVPIVGITAPYYNSTTLDSSLAAECNSNCACPKAMFNPVCGGDKTTYYSPCHAGCTGKVNPGMYTNCSCVARPSAVNSTATLGYCDRGAGCSNYSWFLLVMAINSILFATISVPTRIVVLRCVSYNLRSYALGFQFVFTKLFGFIPSPVLFGTVVDKSCLLWGESCGVKGACSFYDVSGLSDRFLAMILISIGLSTIFYFLSYWYYKPEKEVNAAIEPLMEENPDKNDNKDTGPVHDGPTTVGPTKGSLVNGNPKPSDSLLNDGDWEKDIDNLVETTI